MIQVQKANVLLDIKDEEAQRYLDLGYNILGADGTVVQEAMPTDEFTLRKKCIEFKEKIDELKAEINRLNTIITELQSETADKPKTTRSRK